MGSPDRPFGSKCEFSYRKTTISWAKGSSEKAPRPDDPLPSDWEILGSSKLKEFDYTYFELGLGMLFYDRFLQIQSLAFRFAGLIPVKPGPQSLARRSINLETLPSDSEIWRLGDWEDLGDMRT